MILDPKVLSSIKSLSLMARQSLDGYKLGLNLNFRKGQGMEFSNYRSYQAGDDLRTMDWKMFARSDRYFIRESEIENNISVRFMVDASGSMNHIDQGISKFQYAQILIACMAFLANQQGDSIGLSLFQNGESLHIPLSSDKTGFDRFCHILENTQPGGLFPEFKGFNSLETFGPQKSLFIFITDFYQYQEEQIRFLESLKGIGHEIWTLHLVGKNELELHYPGYSQLEDLETGNRVSIGSGQARLDYMHQIKLHFDKTKQNLYSKNIDYNQFLITESLHEALKQFLKKSSKG